MPSLVKMLQDKNVAWCYSGFCNGIGINVVVKITRWTCVNMVIINSAVFILQPKVVKFEVDSRQKVPNLQSQLQQYKAAKAIWSVKTTELKKNILNFSNKRVIKTLTGISHIVHQLGAFWIGAFWLRAICPGEFWYWSILVWSILVWVCFDPNSSTGMTIYTECVQIHFQN